MEKDREIRPDDRERPAVKDSCSDRMTQEAEIPAAKISPEPQHDAKDAPAANASGAEHAAFAASEAAHAAQAANEAAKAAKAAQAAADAAAGKAPCCPKPRPEKSRRKRFRAILQKYLMIFIGAVIAAVGLELFLIPNNIIDGGVVGLSIMAQAITDTPLGIFLVVLNLPFLYLGYKQIGKSFTVATLAAILFLAFWSAYFAPFPTVTHDPFLSAIFGGIIDGLGVGLIIRAGGSLDGTEIVAIILDKKSVFSVGEVVMFINLFILSSAGLLFGWDKAMYSLVAYFVIAKMIDVVVKGLDESYAVMIVTNEPEEINTALMENMNRGVTLLYGEGGYTGDEKKVLYSVVTRLEVDKLKEIVLDIDESAFVTINAVHDIVGGRFKRK